MPYEISTATDSSGTYSLAHQNFLERIKNQLSSTGFMGAGNEWDVLRYDTASDHELILRGPGLSTTEEIYVGLKLYHSVGADYYNIKAAGFTGYVSGNSWETQPGISGIVGCCLHNTSIAYWLAANGQRLVFGAKVGTPVYEGLYLGKFRPYATPNQYPYPVVAIGTLSGAPATRFSDTASTHSIGYSGAVAQMQMRFVDGSWIQAQTWPYLASSTLAGATNALRDTGDNYPLLPIVLCNSTNVFGELDGVHYITGFNNAVENTLTIASKPYVVIQDVFRTGFNNYYALRLD